MNNKIIKEANKWLKEDEDDDPIRKYDDVKYTVNKTYDVVTPESAEDGDTADSGFEFEDQIYDGLEDLIQSNSNEGWIEWSSSHPDDHDWLISEPSSDMHTGEETSYGLHIRRVDGKPKSEEEIRLISNGFGVRLK